jgi:hypothetical protein
VKFAIKALYIKIRGSSTSLKTVSTSVKAVIYLNSNPNTDGYCLIYGQSNIKERLTENIPVRLFF